MKAAGRLGLACLLSDLAAERDRNCSHQTLTTLLSRKRQEVGEVDLLEENKNVLVVEKR